MPKQLELPFVAQCTIEAWAEAKNTEPHWFAAAKYANAWGIGRVLSEAVYDAAIVAVQTIEVRS